MSWMEHRSNIEIEIAECYEQIEALQQRIVYLRAQQKEQERFERLVLELNKKKKDNKPNPNYIPPASVKKEK